MKVLALQIVMNVGKRRKKRSGTWQKKAEDLLGRLQGEVLLLLPGGMGNHVEHVKPEQ